MSKIHRLIRNGVGVQTLCSLETVCLAYSMSFVGVKKAVVFTLFWKVDFKAFRRLGIPLWDMWRCYQMRLMPQSRSVLSPRGNMVGGESERTDWPHWIRAYVWFSLAEEGDLIA